MNTNTSLNSQSRPPERQPLELWGGLECTVNRVRDDYFSQLDRNGHALRACDIGRFASLGIRAIRYPILWERTAPRASPRPTGPGPTNACPPCVKPASPRSPA